MKPALDRSTEDRDHTGQDQRCGGYVKGYIRQRMASSQGRR
jgi:hypothetical protein